MRETTLVRFNIVNSLLTPNGVFDPRIIHAFQEVSRETFTKISAHDRHEQELITVLVTAKMLQALSIRPQDRVLIIGSTNLFMPALLSFCCKEILVLTNNKQDEKNLKQQSQEFCCNAIKINYGPLQSGLKHAAPYNNIIVEGGVNYIDQSLRNQITLMGKLIYLYPLDNYISYRLIVEQRMDTENFVTKVITECPGFMLSAFNNTIAEFNF